MKKLLSLLSVLTICGSAVPTTIAASSYKQSETNLNNNEFNVNYDDGKILGTISSDSVEVTRENILIEDWTKYANNWEEFEKKFPEIEFKSLSAQLGGQGDTVNVTEFKIPTKLNSSVRLAKYYYHFLVCEQKSYIYSELFIDGKQLKIKHKYFLHSDNAIYHTWAWLKYNSIQLVD